MSSESVLKKFGKYFLLDRIGEGGMADIFRARLATKDGSGRLLVIKRIQAAFGNNQEFLSMFRSEVQVTMRFTHPNIVQLYESGEEQKQQFIAMEFVDGKNLRQVLTKLQSQTSVLPAPMTCYLMEQAASGLHYAHTFKDRISGEPLNLVHRDVSPQNILVSYDGTVKVIDFGIAKATTNGEATRAGVIKGKLSYLSPEQVMGEVLDGRSDVFALGTVMWELLTGRKLFIADGDNEFAVLKMIESCNTYVKPPSYFNAEVSKEIDQIVMHALTREPKKRFQSAEEFSRALRKVLSVQYSDFSSGDLSQYVKKLFHEAIVNDRKSLQALNARAEELIALTVQDENRSSHDAPTRIQMTSQMTSLSQASEDSTRMTKFIGNKFDKSQVTNADKVEVNAAPMKQVRVPRAAQPPAHPTSQSSAQASTQSSNQASSSHSSHASSQTKAHQPFISASDSDSGDGTKVGLIKIAAAIVFMVGGVVAFQNYKSTRLARMPAENPVVEDARPVVASSTQATIQLKVQIYPEGGQASQITLNGRVVRDSGNGIAVPLDEALNLKIERNGFESVSEEFAIKASDVGTATTWTKEVKMAPMNYGKFSLDTIPQVADVKIIRLDQGGGRQVASVLTTPIAGEKLPAGKYRAVIENHVLGMEKTIDFQIQEGRETHPPEVRLMNK